MEKGKIRFLVCVCVGGGGCLFASSFLLLLVQHTLQLYNSNSHSIGVWTEETSTSHININQRKLDMYSLLIGERCCCGSKAVPC